MNLSRTVCSNYLEGKSFITAFDITLEITQSRTNSTVSWLAGHVITDEESVTVLSRLIEKFVIDTPLDDLRIYPALRQISRNLCRFTTNFRKDKLLGRTRLRDDLGKRLRYVTDYPFNSITKRNTFDLDEIIQSRSSADTLREPAPFTVVYNQ